MCLQRDNVLSCCFSSALAIAALAYIASTFQSSREPDMPADTDLQCAGAWPRGASTFEIQGPVLARFSCHYRVGQALCRSPLADTTLP